MRDAVRTVMGVGIGLLCALSVSLPASAHHVHAASGDRPATTPPVSEPTEPTESTEPPASTEPAPDDTTSDDALIGAGDPDGDIDVALAVVAVVGFVALLALASWWMVRRSDPDAEPMPPGSVGGSPPSDLI